MQVQGAAHRGGGVGTIPRHGVGWLGAVLAVAAILVIVALMTREMVAPPCGYGWGGGTGRQQGGRRGIGRCPRRRRQRAFRVGAGLRSRPRRHGRHARFYGRGRGPDAGHGCCWRGRSCDSRRRGQRPIGLQGQSVERKRGRSNPVPLLGRRLPRTPCLRSSSTR